MVKYDNSCTIVIEGMDARIEGFVPWDVVIDVTSYYSAGYQFSPRYRLHQWDGRVRLFRQSTRTFPAGLTLDVKQALEDTGIKVQIDERRKMPPLPPLTDNWKNELTLEGVNFAYPYDYQPEVAEKMLLAKRGIVAVATNGGKCLDPETPVRLFDGRIVSASKVIPGDLLLGPLYQPRKVLSTSRGAGLLYCVVPKEHSKPFICNSFHILTVRDASSKQIVDVPLPQFLKWDFERRQTAQLIRAVPGVPWQYSEFIVSPIPHGNYCGFTLDGDGRFFLGDFTITHNTEIACLVTAALRLPTLFLVPGKELLYQTAKRFSTRLKLSGANACGVIGDGVWNEGAWVTVATVPTIHQNLRKEHTRKLLERTQLLFCDEAHHGGSDTFYLVLRACNAFFRYGMSATPLRRSDGADLRLLGATGPVIAEIRNKELIERGVSSKVNIQIIRITQPDIDPATPYQDVYQFGIVQNPYRNRILCKKIEQLVAQKKSVVVMVKELQHGERLDENLWKYCKFVPHQFINGQEPTAVRQQALADFAKGDLPVLIATSIINEGVDLPNIDAIVLADGGKSSIKTLQRIGRGIRRGGSSDTLIVVDTADFQHSYLLKHSLQRLEDYKSEDCFTIETVQAE